MSEPINDAAVQEMGFKDVREFFFCVSNYDLSTMQSQLDFDRWQQGNGTKDGLLKISPELRRLQRAGDIS